MFGRFGGDQSVKAKTWARKGRRFLQKRRLEKARHCFDKALELDDQLEDAWRGRIDIWFEKHVASKIYFVTMKPSITTIESSKLTLRTGGRGMAKVVALLS